MQIYQEGWAENFSYDFFRNILRAIKPKFKISRFSGAPILKSAKPNLFLRHDVDLDLDKALEMAEIEQSEGVSSTYMFLVGSKMYGINNPDFLLKSRAIVSKGHDVGLHVDKRVQRTCQEILGARTALENAVQYPVQAISFHRPDTETFNLPRVYCEMINSYSQELMQKYFSDSKGVFRKGNPLYFLADVDETPVQLLIHPIWWAETHADRDSRLEQFFKKISQGKTKEEVAKLDLELQKHLSVWRGRK